MTQRSVTLTKEEFENLPSRDVSQDLREVANGTLFKTGNTELDSLGFCLKCEKVDENVITLDLVRVIFEEAKPQFLRD
jgi:hypothetical protein